MPLNHDSGRWGGKLEGSTQPLLTARKRCGSPRTCLRPATSRSDAPAAFLWTGLARDGAASGLPGRIPAESKANLNRDRGPERQNWQIGLLEPAGMHVLQDASETERDGAMRHTKMHPGSATIGLLAKWDEARGFGFIEPTEGPDVFVHIKDFPFHQRRPRAGDTISFEQGMDEQGRRRALNPKIRGVMASTCALIMILLWVASVAYGVMLYIGTIPLNQTSLLISLYVLGCPITFSAYIWDKQKSVTGGWRTPESNLHILEFLGGWLAALLAQHLFRHKNRKIRFKLSSERSLQFTSCYGPGKRGSRLCNRVPERP
jgi:uncharacterized membrane protein YsdA (DUF1294 family)/cold shock CspA family protein